MSDLQKTPGFWDAGGFIQCLAPPLKLSHLHIDQGKLYYLETRPEEQGRSVIIANDNSQECHGREFNIKTRVNEYGGQCFTCNNNLLVFFDLTSQTLYIKDSSTDQLKAVYHKQKCYFADLHLDPKNSFVYAVMEDKNTESCPAFLVRLCLSTNNLEILHSSQDFYAQPRVSPCGKQLAFLSWNHPSMPWDENVLWIANLANDSMSEPQIIFKKQGASCDQLTFSMDSQLYFTCDQEGYSQLFTFKEQIQQLTFVPINFGINHWVYGVRRLSFINQHQIGMIGTAQALDALYLFDCRSHTLETLDTPFTSITELACSNGAFFCIAASTISPYGLYKIDSLSLQISCLKTSETQALDPGFISKPQKITITTHEISLHGFYYPPCNPSFSCTDQPPLILKIHSGPTAHLTPRYQPEIYFFTSKGFAFFELNYRGSSGYSKEFQNKLNGGWGCYEVEDVMLAANFLVTHRLAHPQLLFLKGSSAGGFTVLNILCKTSMFTGATSYYGISDLTSLVNSTHKFEKHYLDTLVGSYIKNPEIFYERSPIHHLNKISTPLLLFHGQKDPVVPIKQTIMVCDALKAQGNIVESIYFQEEGHGFKLSKTLNLCLAKELSFYQMLAKPIVNKIS